MLRGPPVEAPTATLRMIRPRLSTTRGSRRSNRGRGCERSAQGLAEGVGHVSPLLRHGGLAKPQRLPCSSVRRWPLRSRVATVRSARIGVPVPRQVVPRCRLPSATTRSASSATASRRSLGTQNRLSPSRAHPPPRDPRPLHDPAKHGEPRASCSAIQDPVAHRLPRRPANQRDQPWASRPCFDR